MSQAQKEGCGILYPALSSMNILPPDAGSMAGQGQSFECFRPMDVPQDHPFPKLLYCAHRNTSSRKQKYKRPLYLINTHEGL